MGSSTAKIVAHSAFLLATLAANAGQAVPLRGDQADLKFTHISTENGLSHTQVYSIVQDHQGFIWFGTLDGLDRYDGNKIKVYQHDDRDSGSLIENFVFVLYVDRAGTLWVGTNGGGLDRYDRHTDSFVHYRHAATDPNSLVQDTVKSLYEDNGGTLWVGTNGGLAKLDRTTGTFTNYRHNASDASSLSLGEIHSIFEEQGTGFLWIGLWRGGICVFDRAAGRCARHYQHDANDRRTVSSNSVFRLLQDRTGEIWASTDLGLNRFDRERNAFIHYRNDPADPASVADNDLKAIYEDSRNRFWVATSSGLDLFDRKSGKAIHYRNDPGNPDSLRDDKTRDIYEDGTGALWISTMNQGVSRLSGEPERFITYRHSFTKAQSLSHNSVQAIEVDPKGNLWIGTAQGINYFDGKTFTSYLHNPRNANSLSSDDVRSLAVDSRGTLWVGTAGGGLNRLTAHGFRHWFDPDNPASVISALCPSRRGGVWMSEAGIGLDYFDGHRFTHYHYREAESDPRALPAHYLISILEDEAGVLWLGSANMGLIRFDPATSVFKPFLLDPEHPDSEAINRVTSIYPDHRGSLWLGSQGGLFRFDLASTTFADRYTKSHGLPTDSIVSVLGDGDGSLWVGTTAGLSRFDLKRRKFRNYDEEDGLQGNQFVKSACARARGGLMFFGGVNGLSAFYPSLIADNPHVPPVVFTDFELFNQPVGVRGNDSPLSSAITAAQEIRLRHAQSVFTIGFAALNYSAPNKNRYAYRLEGFDADWRFTDAHRPAATYTNLDPGVYTFRVRGSNNDGAWNLNGAAIRIIVLTPWWGTWWFRGFLILALGGFALAAYQVRIRTLEERERRFRTLAENDPDVVARFDRELRYAYVNAAIERYIGVRCSSLIGRSNQELGMLREVGEVWDAAARRVLETGSSLSQEFEAVTALGKRSLESLLVPEFAANSVNSVLIITRDITGRKQAEEAQREAERKYRTIFEEAVVGIFQTSPQGGFLSANPAMARMFGYDSPEELTTSVTDIFHQVYVDPKQGDEFRASIERHGFVRNFECQVYRKDGSKFWISESARAIYKDGALVGFEGMSEDITERKTLEQQLLQVQKMDAVGRLAGGVAHDFNNLITVIKGYCRLLFDSQQDMEVRSRLAQIEKASDSAGALTQQLLAFSRRQVVETTVLDLNTLLVNFDAMLRRLIGEDIEMVTRPAPDLGLIRGDAAQIEQIIMNLAVNARDAMPSGGKLILETANAEMDAACSHNQPGAVPGRYAMLAVSDSGTGMDEPTQAKIFEPFFTTKEVGRGTGLGLSTVYGIVKQSGGYINVYSELGRGTTFKIYFPQVQEGVTQEPRAQLPVRVLTEMKTILLVEDNEQVREFASHVLEASNCRVLTAATPSAALAIAEGRSEAIALLITDVIMPEMNGRELAHAITVECPEIKILYMSGYTSNGLFDKEVLSDREYFLQKPFTADALRAKVLDIVDSAHRSRASAAPSN